MKKLFLLGALFWLGTSCVFAQIYRAGEGVKQALSAQEKPALWALSLEAAADTSRLRDPSGDLLSRGDLSLGLRALYTLNAWVSLGLEGAVSKAASAKPVIDKFSSRRLAALAKVELMPEAFLRSYLLFGLGAEHRELAYLHLLDKKQTSLYLTLGAGTEINVTDSFFTALEVKGVYHADPYIGNYFRLDHRWSCTLALRTGVRF